MGAGRLATGHYARVVENNGQFGLRRGLDAEKDQSYFLAKLAMDQLAQSVFPLGELKKKDIEVIATARGLRSRESKSSQELCFISEGSHGDWIDVRSLDTAGPGEIVDTGGRKIGEHLGIHRYTVGQRKGLGIATGKPMYVVSIDPAGNRVVMGDRSDVMKHGMRVEDVDWISGSAPAVEFRALIQIRYNHEAAPALVSVREGGIADVAFDEPQFAITPGQLAAFYNHDDVAGAGWIARPM